MSTPERDRSVERLLAGMRRAGSSDAAAGEACVDAADLAAWADGALPPSRATVVESHLASCARCQSMAAAFAKAEPVAAPRAFWSRWQIVVPVVVSSLAAATFFVALWRGRTPQVAPSATIAQTGTAPVTVPPALVPAAPATPAQSQPPAQPGEIAEPPAQAARPQPSLARPTPLSSSSAEAKPAAQAPPRSNANDQKAAGRGDFSTDQMLKTPTARDPWHVVNMAPGIVLSPPNVGGSASGQQLTVSAFGTSSNVQWNLESGNITDVPVVAAFSATASSPAMRVAGGGGGRGRAGGVARAQEAATAQPGSSVSWRILADGHVDRSIDNGASWMRMSTDPTLFITAGAATAPTTCWLGGRAGVVLMTTDNEHFTRVDLPERVDIKSIQAERDLVTVVTTTGVTYTSADAGKTWQRRE